MPALCLCAMVMLEVPPVALLSKPDLLLAADATTSAAKASPAMIAPAFGAPREEAALALALPEPDMAPAAPGAMDAQAPVSLIAGGAEELGDDVLAEQRGGFSIDGLDISLGAQIETFIDGQLSLVTTVNWTDTAATTTRTVSGLLTPASAAELQAGLLNTGQISMNVGDASVFLAHGGRTAVLHNTDSGIQSVLINTANNTSIRTEVTATLDLSGYAGFRQSLQIGALAGSLGQAIGAAITGSVTN